MKRHVIFAVKCKTNKVSKMESCKCKKFSHMMRDNPMKRIIRTIINRYHYGNTCSGNNVTLTYNRFHNLYIASVM